MGENVNLDRIKNVAKKMSKNLENQIEESKNKEKKFEYQQTVKTMDEDDIKKELETNRGIYSQLEFTINSKSDELSTLKRNPDVKRYIHLISQVEDFENEKKLISDKIAILEKQLCNHEILYLMTFPKQSTAYFPTFRCLCCDGSVNGFIREDQIVVNKDFLEEDEFSFKGNITEYLSTKYKYFELLELGESEEEILLEIEDQLNVNHSGKKKSVKLLRKKEDR